MSGVLCRRRPRFDYTLSQSAWMKNTDLCQSQNGGWAWRTGLMEMPKGQRPLKDATKTYKLKNTTVLYLLFTYSRGILVFSSKLLFFLRWSLNKSHGKVYAMEMRLLYSKGQSANTYKTDTVKQYQSKKKLKVGIGQYIVSYFLLNVP